MMNIIKLAIICFFIVLTLGCGSDGGNVRSEIIHPNDYSALEGLTAGKGFFDVNLSADLNDPEPALKKLALYLDVVRKTHYGLEEQNVEADLVIAFRGTAVNLITIETTDEIKAQVSELFDLGVKFEACNIATTLFGVNNSEILQEINVVGNTFISAIGYQSKGYSPILIQ